MPLPTSFITATSGYEVQRWAGPQRIGKWYPTQDILSGQRGLRGPVRSLPFDFGSDVRLMASPAVLHHCLASRARPQRSGGVGMGTGRRLSPLSVCVLWETGKLLRRSRSLKDHVRWAVAGGGGGEQITTRTEQTHAAAPTLQSSVTGQKMQGDARQHDERRPTDD